MVRKRTFGRILFRRNGMEIVLPMLMCGSHTTLIFLLGFCDFDDIYMSVKVARQNKFYRLLLLLFSSETQNLFAPSISKDTEPIVVL